MFSPTISVVGLGYIGLPTAVLLASHGVKVTGIDIDPERVNRINKGEPTIKEAGLDQHLTAALKANHFSASTEYVRSDNFIIAVPTPFGDNHDIDMSFIFSAVDSISPLLKGGELIVLESTVPPGTTRRMAERLATNRPDLVTDDPSISPTEKTVFVAHCPERVLSGAALQELCANDRVIGGLSPFSSAKAKTIYEIFCKGELHTTSVETAEMTKLTENAFRDVNIAFANELSLICDNLSIDISELISLANRHPRVEILNPGPGVGGHCIAVDPWFIVSSNFEDSKLIQTARQINDSKPHWVIEKTQKAIRERNPKNLAILGLTFKPNIDDLRESPALLITEKLAKLNPELEILIVEPNIHQLPYPLDLQGNLSLTSLKSALNDADIIVLLVAHDEFKYLTSNQDIKGKLMNFLGNAVLDNP